MDEIYDLGIEGLNFNKAIGRILPNYEQALLINTAIKPAPIAIQLWQQWKVYRKINSQIVTNCNYLPSIYDVLDDECQRLLPLIFRNLEYSNDFHALLLKSYYKHIWVKNQQTLATVFNIINDLKDLGVDCVVLKGLAMTIGYYKDAGLRVSGDYDLLVPYSKKQVTIDYFKNKHSINLTLFQKLQILEYHAINVKLANGIDIDIHWNLNYENALSNNTDILFNDARVVEASNKKLYKILSPTHQVFHAITHGISVSKNYSIRWITDCFIINKYELIDWKVVSDLCLQYNYKIPFAIACKVLPLFDVQIPQKILDNVSKWKFTQNELFFYNLVASYKGKKDSWYKKIVGNYSFKKAMFNQFKKGKASDNFIVWYLKSFTLAFAIWLKKRL